MDEELLSPFLQRGLWVFVCLLGEVTTCAWLDPEMFVTAQLGDAQVVLIIERS